MTLNNLSFVFNKRRKLKVALDVDINNIIFKTNEIII